MHALQETEHSTRALLRLMLAKAAVLACLLLWRHANSWAADMPDAVISAAPPGLRCAIVWPPPGFTLAPMGRGTERVPMMWWEQIAAFAMRCAGVHTAPRAPRFGRLPSLLRTPSDSRKPSEALAGALCDSRHDFNKQRDLFWTCSMLLCTAT